MINLIRLLVFFIGLFLCITASILIVARREAAQPAWRVITRYDHRGAHLYRVQADQQDSNALRLTEKRGIYRSPVWSPDGRWIALVDYSLMLVSADGRTIKSLTTTYDGSPAWSPDGKWIVFMSYQENTWDIYKIQVETGKTVRLTFTPEDDVQPYPSGDWIYFQSYQHDEWRSFRVPSDGSGIVEPLDFPAKKEEGAGFSPVIDYAWRGEILIGMGIILMVVGLMGGSIKFRAMG